MFTGHLARPAVVAAVLASADVALACCPVETFGLAALEAMACGTPVVIAEGGGAPELAVPGAAIVAPPTVGAFASAAAALLAVDAQQTRAAARARAEEFPWSATVERMLIAHEAAESSLSC